MRSMPNSPIIFNSNDNGTNPVRGISLVSTDSVKKFDLVGDFLDMMIHYQLNVDQPTSWEKNFY